MVKGSEPRTRPSNISILKLYYVCVYTFVYDQTTVKPGPAQQEIVPQHVEKRSKPKCPGRLNPHSTQMRSLRGRGEPAKLSGRRPAHGNKSFSGGQSATLCKYKWGVVRGPALWAEPLRKTERNGGLVMIGWHEDRRGLKLAPPRRRWCLS